MANIQAPSRRFTLNRQDLVAWFKNAAWFTAPVILIYVLSVTGKLEQANHVLSLNDFVPTSTVVTAMVLWVLNRFVDVLRRFVAGR
jgi:hypothetical protein